MSSSSGSSYVDHWLVGLSECPTPRHLRVAVAPPGALQGPDINCSVLREHAHPAGVTPARPCSRQCGAKSWQDASTVTAARGRPSTHSRVGRGLIR